MTVKTTLNKSGSIWIALILIISINYQLVAQSPFLDSLKIEVSKSMEDTNKVYLLIDLSKNNAMVSPDDAISYGNEALDLSKKLKFTNGEALALKYIGMGYYFQSQYLETIHYWQSSYEVFEKMDNTKGMANMLSNIGAIYFNQGDDTKAIDYYLKTLKVAEEIGDSLRIATVLNNIGGVYFNKESTRDMALEYYKRAYNVSSNIVNIEDIGSSAVYEAIGTSAVNTGGYYLEKQNADSALYFLSIALKSFENTSNGNISYALNNMGEAYAIKKDFKRAKEYQNNALDIARRNNNIMDLTLALIALGDTYTLEENYKTAIEYYKQAEKYATEIGVDYQLEASFKALAKLFATISDYKQAYHYQKLFSEIKDTLYNAENDKKIQRLQFNYDIENKQKEVDILTMDKELQELEVKRQKLVKNIFLLGLVFILIIALLLFRNIRVKIKINRILDKQKDEIESLLLNILPAKVAKELQISGKATPRHYDSVSVLFTDFKGFSKIAEGLTPNELVSELNEFFVAFDKIAEKHNLEKIKTIGDAYMCAGGIPVENNSHPLDTVRAGLEMQKFMLTNNEKRKSEGKIPWELRVGIHSGPIVAGVVGKKKYAYDIWGSTVNISSRMESNGEAGRINISSSTYEEIKDHYKCVPRGKIHAKNIGDIDMYFIEESVSSNINTLEKSNN